MDRFTTRSWAQIVDFYHDLVHEHHRDIEPMLQLVQFVAASPYAQALFPITSVAKLRIGRYENFAPGDAELQIEFDEREQQFTFTYLAHPYQKHPWRRTCSAAAGIIRLERFLLEDAGWFTSHGAPPQA